MQGKAILISGGFGVLGRAVAEAVVKAKAKPFLVDRAPMSDLPEGFPGLGDIDLTVPALAARAAAAANEVLGGVDGLVNAAGGFVWKPVAEAGIDDWRRMFDINLATCVNLSQATIPYLMGSPRCPSIVNVAAKGALTAAAGMAPYAASKQGVLKLTEALAEELKDAGVRVNAVLPTIIDTPQNREDMPKSDPTRWVAPADLAAVIAFLLSDAAFAVTGAQIVVAGRT